MISEPKLPVSEQLSHWLIQRAASRVPDALSERLQEEWLADLAHVHGRMARLRFALGCCWATNVIVRDYRLAIAPAASVPVTHGRSIGIGLNFPGISRRAATFLVVAGLHMVVLYVVASGLGVTLVKAIPLPLQTRMIDTPRARPLPPPTHPILKPTPFVIPNPEFPPIEAKTPEQIDATIGDTKDLIPLQPDPPSTGPHITHRVVGGPGKGFPSTDEFYPSMSIHLGESGIATVKTCVDGHGRLTSDPTIVESTQFVRLDEAALKLARAGSGHYRPTSENGQPVNSCYPFRIRFDLKN